MLNHQDQLSGLLAALADPTRRAIVERLSQRAQSVSELAEPLDISLAAVLQHVQTLEACGAIITEKQGRTRRCRINASAFSAIQDWISERRRFWHSQFDNLEALLDGETRKPPRKRSKLQ